VVEPVTILLSATQTCEPMCRLSVSLTQQHQQLSDIVRKNRASAAWIVREAIKCLFKHNRLFVQAGQA